MPSRSRMAVRLGAHLVLVERLDGTEQVALLDLAPEEDVGADVEVAGQGQVLVDGLDARLARLDGAREVHLRPSKKIWPASGW